MVRRSGRRGHRKDSEAATQTSGAAPLPNLATHRPHGAGLPRRPGTRPISAPPAGTRPLGYPMRNNASLPKRRRQHPVSSALRTVDGCLPLRSPPQQQGDARRRAARWPATVAPCHVTPEQVRSQRHPRNRMPNAARHSQPPPNAAGATYRAPSAKPPGRTALRGATGVRKPPAA